MITNRKYKDSVFSRLFSRPDTIRELYGALAGITLSPDIPITINTLEGVLFKGRMNDLSFLIGGVLVILLEHQSTINENMPLRLLLYIANIYEAFTGKRDLYRSRLLSLPRPEFIVLYNGKKPYPDENVLKLSDAFRDPSELGLDFKPEVPLELKVKVYNINPGHNDAIIRRCKTLGDYSAFIEKVRDYGGERKNREEAIKRAIKDCVRQDILKDFLESHSKEVMNMLLTEWNWDDALAVSKEEGWEEGREEGRREAAAEYAEQIRRLEEENRRLREIRSSKTE
ncbi:MAG: Rpn family recombination-promoting nuclease/putative transposase [Treponema sp.]|nr:Rpn family recombination-promoting nuclease/putative transposase [Treponema sp.]